MNFQVSEIQLTYKSKVKASERPKITSSKDAAAILREQFDEDRIELQEFFKAIYLNRANKVLAVYSLSEGGGTGTVVDTRFLLKAALDLNAKSFIVAHNHPSGNLQPSNMDKEITKKISSAAKLFDMQLLDHIILTAEGYTSFADEGWLN